MKIVVVLIKSSRMINQSFILIHKLFMGQKDIIANVFNGDKKVV